MRSALAILCTLAILLAAGFIGTSARASIGPIPPNCNRACLEDLVDRCLAAVVAHDPKRLPLSADAVYTENDQVIDIGDGFWKTAEGLGNYKHISPIPNSAR